MEIKEHNSMCAEQEKLSRKALVISRLEKDTIETEGELSRYKSNTKITQGEWENVEIEVDKLKWMQEKASIVLDSNRKMNEVQSKTMESIRRNYTNLTRSAFKTVRQETTREMINNEINNLADSKKKLESELRWLRETNEENKNRFAKASMELARAKARAVTVTRLRQKLQESETCKLNAVKKLNTLKSLQI
ncbi:myosin-2 heavy chain-like [Diprion similis]|uniref:myosin-2 heavy chain-like n=1 Tax=Diprion similis TaxID=362088 RepID=UPI001EF7CDB4|nr:myosin-2 heavy chain-like [Diprion similis]